jgi:hypothetical protein
MKLPRKSSYGRMGWLNIRCFVKMPVLLSGLMLYAGQGRADTMHQTWSVFASEEYVTNPLLNPADQSQSVWRSTLAPNYMLTDTLDADVLNAGLGIMFVRSSNTNLVANRNSPTASLGWKRMGDKGEFGISTKYNRDSTFLTEPGATGVVSANSTRTSRDLSADWIRELSQRTTLTLNGGYTKVTYSGSGNSTTLSDYTSKSGGMKLNYALSEHSATFVNLSYVNRVPTGNGNDSHQYNARLGLDWNASEHIDWSLQAGPSKLESAGTSTTSTQGGMTMNYKEQRVNLALSANRQSTPSGLGAIVTADQANANLSYDLSERNQTGLDLGWRKSNYQTGNEYRSAGIWLHHDISTYWGLKTYFNYNTSAWGGSNTATSKILGLSLAYTNF